MSLFTFTDEFHRQLIQENFILLYMKGTPQHPRCGFSQAAVRILAKCDATFKAIDVLNPDIRTELKNISKWPTFPQLYIGGELKGGSDIMAQLYASGELQKALTQTKAGS